MPGKHGRDAVSFSSVENHINQVVASVVARGEEKWCVFAGASTGVEEWGGGGLG